MFCPSPLRWNVEAPVTKGMSPGQRSIPTPSNKTLESLQWRLFWSGQGTKKPYPVCCLHASSNRFLHVLVISGVSVPPPPTLPIFWPLESSGLPLVNNVANHRLYSVEFSFHDAWVAATVRSPQRNSTTSRRCPLDSNTTRCQNADKRFRYREHRVALHLPISLSVHETVKGDTDQGSSDSKVHL